MLSAAVVYKEEGKGNKKIIIHIINIEQALTIKI